MVHDTAQLASGGASRGEPLALAGIWARAASASIDLTSIGVGLLISLGALRSGGILAGPEDGAMIADQRALAVFGAAWLALTSVVVAACWRTLGASPGGMLLGCRVVDARTGHRLRWGRAWLRVLGTVVALLPLGLGWLAAAWHPRRRGWHDRIAGTEVVVEDESRASLDDWLKHFS